MQNINSHRLDNKAILSIDFNMSLGFIPVIITIILGEFTIQNAAAGIGMVIGWFYSIYSYTNRTKRPPNFMLYLCTLILTLLFLGSLIPGETIPPKAFSMTLEISIFILALLLLLHKKRFINMYLKKKELSGKKLFIQGTESTFVAINIYLLLVFLHLIVIAFCLIFLAPFSLALSKTLFQYCPLALFILTIILNLFGIHYFNKIAYRTEYFPIVNVRGEVIGKTLAAEAFHTKTTHIFPVVRVAILCNGMLYLSRRPSFYSLDPDKIDLPCESYLRFGETLTDACKRMLKKRFPGAKDLNPNYSIMYRFENNTTNRLIYLYILEIDEEYLTRNTHFIDGKLWQVQQIEQNLGCGYFSECFENEFDYLKDIIDIKEKYRVS